MRSSDNAMRWVWRGSALGALLIGWMFILFHNNFHVSPAVVFIGLGYLAGIATIYALFKTGAAAVASTPDDAADAAAWGLTAGARDELEREKRTLLKAIKEAEFDHQMGKLSKRDVDEMIRQYRLRAIEVIKLLEGGQEAGTPREQIQRELRARLEIEAVRDKIEKAHAGLAGRKHKKKAAAAAQQAARAAAAAGMPAPVVAKIAAEAALRTDLEDGDDGEGADTANAEAKAAHAAQAEAEVDTKADDAAKAEAAATARDVADAALADAAAKADGGAKPDAAATAGNAAKHAAATAGGAAKRDGAATAEHGAAAKATPAAAEDDAGGEPAAAGSQADDQAAITHEPTPEHAKREAKEATP